MDTAVWWYIDLLRFICISLVLARWRELLPVRSQGLVVIVLNNIDSPLFGRYIRDVLVASAACGKSGIIICIVLFKTIVILPVLTIGFIMCLSASCGFNLFSCRYFPHWSAFSIVGSRHALTWLSSCCSQSTT